VEVDFWIHKVLDLGVNPNPRAGSVPFQEQLDNVKVSMPRPVSAAYAILSFHRARGLAQGLGGNRGEPWDTSPPKDVARQEIKMPSMRKRGLRKRERVRSTAYRVAQGRGCTPPGSGSSCEEGEEGRDFF
jgi:hypothetical protein